MQRFKVIQSVNKIYLRHKKIKPSGICKIRYEKLLRIAHLQDMIINNFFRNVFFSFTGFMKEYFENFKLHVSFYWV